MNPVHSLRCLANTGSRKLIRLLSMSRFLPTPMLMTQLCSCERWMGGRETKPSGLEGTRKASPTLQFQARLMSLYKSGCCVCMCAHMHTSCLCLCGLCVPVLPSVYVCAPVCVHASVCVCDGDVEMFQVWLTMQRAQLFLCAHTVGQKQDQGSTVCTSLHGGGKDEGGFWEASRGS